MSDYSIISVLSFILNSVLLSGFIIPQAQKLKEVKDSLIRFKLTSIPQGLNYQEAEPYKKQQEKDIEGLHNNLDVYRVRSNELSGLIKIFYLSILVALMAAVLLFECGGVIINLNGSQLSLGKIIPLFHMFFQLSILLFAIKTYAVAPDKLQDAQYLVEELLINPHSLASAMDLQLSYSVGNLIGPHSRKDPLLLNLFTDLRVFGFRYLFLISGSDEKIYYFSFGPIIANSRRIHRYFTLRNELVRKDEYHRIDIGKFPFNLVKERQTLNFTLLIFLPFFKHEEYSPMISMGQTEVHGVEGNSYMIGSGSGSWPISPLRTFDKIQYAGKGIKIKEIRFKGDLDDTRSKVVKRVIDKFAKKIAQTGKVCEYTSVDGELLLN